MNLDRLDHRKAQERGQTTLLILGFFVIVLLTVALAVDASAAYLRRQGLASLADAAALAAADGVKAEQVYAGHLGGEVTIDPDVAHRYAAAYLDQVEALERYPDLTLRVGVTRDTVTVRLEAPVDLPLAPPSWENQPVVAGESAAYVVVGE